MSTLKSMLATWYVLNNSNLPVISQDELEDLVESGRELARVEMVYPTPDLINETWDYIISKEYSHTKPTEGSAQWLEWVYRGKTIPLLTDYDSFQELAQSNDSRDIKSLWGYVQDSLAIAPLNITPQFLGDMINRKKFLFYLCEQAMRGVAKDEVESLLRSVLVVSGMPRHTGDIASRYKWLWNKRSVKFTKELLPAVFNVTFKDGVSVVVRVR